VLDVKEIDREIWLKLALELAWTDTRIQKQVTDEPHLSFTLEEIAKCLFVPGKK